MKNLHIFKNTNSKFSEPYIKFINSNFDSTEHQFLLVGKDRLGVFSIDNLIEISTNFKEIIPLIALLNKSNKIFLHGLFLPNIILILFMQPWLLKKCNWIMWGGDLYYYKLRKRSIKNNLYEILRKTVIKNFGGIITHVKGDYQLAKKWYGIKGEFQYSFMYPSNLYNGFEIPKKTNKTNICIQVGNSADPSNNHIEIFNKLKTLNRKDIQIIVPLSYGNKDYAKMVEKIGRQMFGEQFTPLLEFIPYNDYMMLLYDMDIAIFNHNRQQAIGTITSLLGFGKKVYIRDDITTWSFCEEHELKVYSISKDFDDVLNRINDFTQINNILNVKSKFSEEKLIHDLNKIYR